MMETVAWIVLFVSSLYLLDRLAIWAGSRWLARYRAKHQARRNREAGH
jgi:hypothetical protein